MNTNQNIYALYQGEHNLTDGTIREIAKNQGVLESAAAEAMAEK